MLGGTSLSRGAAAASTMRSAAAASSKRMPTTTRKTSKITNASASRPGLSTARVSALTTQKTPQSYALPSNTTNKRIAAQFSALYQRRRTDVSSSAADASSSAATSTTSTTSTSGPALSSLELLPIIDQQGYIAPPIPEGSSAAVLAIYSENRTLQLVAFSADPRKSLTTLVGRRPDRAFFYRAAFFPAVEQEVMVALREAWFKENAGAPVGNKLALERDAWTQPVSAGAISERGRRAAAEGQAAELLKVLRSRGCNEDLIPDEALLDAGKVDFLPALETSEDRAVARQASEARSAAERIIKLPKGVVPPVAECTISRAFPTNGGVMFDVTLAHDSSETEHRVIVGKRFYEPVGKTAEDALGSALSFLLWTQTDRHTDGMLLSSQFNANYFAAAELESMWGDAFEEHLEDAGLTKRSSTAGDEGEKRGGIYSTEVWRFARTHDYKDEGVAVPTSYPLWV